jgi:S-adenosylmethionine:tRNA ribosyltransferase-isomerase
MQTADFDYDLPAHFIAQQPAEPRDSSRLLVLERATGKITHTTFAALGEWLRAGDILVANDSRVIPARMHGHKASGGAIELLLLRQLDDAGALWECLIRGKGMRPGAELHFGDSVPPLIATVEAADESGTRTVRFAAPVRPWLDDLGETPLPPYITAWHGDPERYQTIYSRPEGSAAAPTAGLHFTPELLMSLRDRIEFETVTLHVGLDTFKPVESERVEDHQIHSEWAEVTSATARRINDAVLRGGRVVAVGTTATRTLEWASTAAQGIDAYAPPEACPWKRVAAFTGDVSLFIRPGYTFRAVDALITNFHLPRSSLLMLVSAFIAQLHPTDADAGRRILLAAYEEAKAEGYRFFSFGDAMLIV